MKAERGAPTQPLLSEVRRRRSHKTLVEVPPRQSHQSNGPVENAVRRLESLVRTYVAELEARLSVKIGASAPTLPWLVRHAAFVHRENRRQKLVGATPRTMTPVHWRQSARLSTSSSCGRSRTSWNPVGVPESSWVATRSSLERRVASSSPGHFVGERRKAGGLEGRGTRAVCRWRHQWPAAEDVYITKSIVAESGATPGCLACVRASNTHTVSCRARLEEIFGGLGDVKEQTIEAPRVGEAEEAVAPMFRAQRGADCQDHRGLLATSRAGLKRAGEEQHEPESKRQAVPNVADVMVQPLGETATVSSATADEGWSSQCGPSSRRSSGCMTGCGWSRRRCTVCVRRRRQF